MKKSKNKNQNLKKLFLVLNEKEKPFLVMIAKKRLWFLICAGSYKKWVWNNSTDHSVITPTPITVERILSTHITNADNQHTISAKLDVGFMV